jgi:hypothetical protein
MKALRVKRSNNLRAVPPQVRPRARSRSVTPASVTANPKTGRVTICGPLSVALEHRARELGVTPSRYVSSLIERQVEWEAETKRRNAAVKRSLTALRSSKAALRFAEIDAHLDIDGSAEYFLDGILVQIVKDGEPELIIDGFEFDKGRLWASGRLGELVDRWKAEDAEEQADETGAQE